MLFGHPVLVILELLRVFWWIKLLEFRFEYHLRSEVTINTVRFFDKSIPPS
jgi:hypothetical protein